MTCEAKIPSWTVGEVRWTRVLVWLVDLRTICPPSSPFVVLTEPQTRAAVTQRVNLAQQAISFRIFAPSDLTTRIRGKATRKVCSRKCFWHPLVWDRACKKRRGCPLHPNNNEKAGPMENQLLSQSIRGLRSQGKLWPRQLERQTDRCRELRLSRNTATERVPVGQESVKQSCSLAGGSEYQS